jgi:hypothetical protein
MIKHVWQNTACGEIGGNELHGTDVLEELMICQVPQINLRSLIEIEYIYYRVRGPPLDPILINPDHKPPALFL